MDTAISLFRPLSHMADKYQKINKSCKWYNKESTTLEGSTEIKEVKFLEK